MSRAELYFPSRLLTRGAVIAGFSTRHGGDRPEELARAAGFRDDRLFTLTQVHSAVRLVVTERDVPAAVGRRKADALVTRRRGVALAVRTADCVPVLLASPSEGVIAAVHAGWRGLVAGVVQESLGELMRLAGVSVSEVSAAVGPAIDGCCFEVGQEVADELTGAVSDHKARELVRAGPSGRPYVDLREAVRQILLGSGLAGNQIELVGPCTRCASSLFHSYRREGPGGGRQLAFIYLRK